MPDQQLCDEMPALIERSFFKILWRELKLPGYSFRRTKESRIRTAAIALQRDNEIDPGDRPGLRHRQIACLVLAAYRDLSGDFDRTDLAGALEAAVVEPGGRIITWFTRIMLFFSRNPMSTMVNYTRKSVPPRYGPTFSFSEEGSDNDSFTLRVNKCYYHGFFLSNGTPELTKLFCRWDKHWIEPISPQLHGMKFLRPTTLAAGHDSCTFTFSRVETDK